MAFRRDNEIISLEEYNKIRDGIEYGRVINHYLKFCLKNRKWEWIVSSLGLDIESILNNCELIKNENDVILSNYHGIFASRVFELVRVLDANLDKCQEDDLNKLRWIISYLKNEQQKILIELAKSDLEKVQRNDVLDSLRGLYNYGPGYSEKARDVLLEFDAKEHGVINEDVISDLQGEEIINRILLSFYDYYDFNGSGRKIENNYPVYIGTDIREALAWECIQYPHYVAWQKGRLDTRIKEAVVSPYTISLLHEICSDEILENMLDVVKKMDVRNMTLDKFYLDVPKRRLVLSDSFVQFDEGNRLTYR